MSDARGGAGLPELRVAADADAVAEAAAREIAHGLAAAIAARGVAHWVTTGGSVGARDLPRLGPVAAARARSTGRASTPGGATTGSCRPTIPSRTCCRSRRSCSRAAATRRAAARSRADVGGHGDGVRIPASQIHQIPMTEAIAHAGGAAWAAAGYVNAIGEHGPAADAAAGSGGLPAFDVFVAGRRARRPHPVGVPGLGRLGRRRAVRRRAGADRTSSRTWTGSRCIPAWSRPPGAWSWSPTGASKAGVLGPGVDRRRRPRAPGPRRAARPRATWILDEAAAADLPRVVGDALPAPFPDVPSRRVVAADGTPIAVFSAGAGRPLVLVHGTTADHRTWRVVGPELATRWRLHAIDRRGRGDSGDGDPDHYAIEREFDDLVAVVEAVADEDGGARSTSSGTRWAAGSRWARACGRRRSGGSSPTSRRRSPPGEEAPRPGARCPPARGPRGGRPRRHAGAVHDRGHRHAPGGPGGVPRRPDLAAARRGRADDPARARRRGARSGGRARRAGRRPASRSSSSWAPLSPASFRTGAEALDARLAHGRLEVIEGARHGAHHSHAAEFIARTEAFLDA